MSAKVLVRIPKIVNDRANPSALMTGPHLDALSEEVTMRGSMGSTQGASKLSPPAKNPKKYGVIILHSLC